MIAALRRLPRLESAIALAAVAVLIAVGLVREQAAQNQVTELDSFSSYDAKSGGYRAWYELLTREGVSVERFELPPAFLDHSTGTLIWGDPLIFDPRQEMPSQNDLKALESWVRGGGRMLYLGHDDFAAGAGVLKLPHSARKRKHGQPFVAASLVARGVGRVESVSDLRWARAKSRSVLLADAAGPLVVRYPLGKGEVVAAIDEQAFTNGRIARADAARLAYALALPKRAGARVTFDETVHGFITPEHWWSVIPRPFAIAIWSALGVLLVALAGAALRLGPPVVPVRHAEASSAAFLDALAALFERGNAIRKVLRDAAASVTRAVAGALGMPDDLPTERLAAAMGEPAQRDAYLELMRIAEGGAPNRANLVRGIALAQRLRKELGSHGRSRN